MTSETTSCPDCGKQGIHTCSPQVQPAAPVAICPTCGEEDSGTSCGPNCGWITGGDDEEGDEEGDDGPALLGDLALPVLKNALGALRDTLCIAHPNCNPVEHDVSGWYAAKDALENLLYEMTFDERCTDYHCAGDCGLRGHDIAKPPTHAASLTDERIREIYVSRTWTEWLGFARDIEAEVLKQAPALRELSDKEIRDIAEEIQYTREWDDVDIALVRACIAAARSA